MRAELAAEHLRALPNAVGAYREQPRDGGPGEPITPSHHAAVEGLLRAGLRAPYR